MTAIEPRPWRSVPDGAIVIGPDSRPHVAGRWLGPDPVDLRNAWRLLDDKPVVVVLDALVPTFAAPESAVLSMFRNAGFTIDGVIACPPST